MSITILRKLQMPTNNLNYADGRETSLFYRAVKWLHNLFVILFYLFIFLRHLNNFSKFFVIQGSWSWLIESIKMEIMKMPKNIACSYGNKRRIILEFFCCSHLFISNVVNLKSMYTHIRNFFF